MPTVRGALGVSLGCRCLSSLGGCGWRRRGGGAARLVGCALRLLCVGLSGPCSCCLVGVVLSVLPGLPPGMCLPPLVVFPALGCGRSLAPVVVAVQWVWEWGFGLTRVGAVAALSFRGAGGLPLLPLLGGGRGG